MTERWQIGALLALAAAACSGGSSSGASTYGACMRSSDCEAPDLCYFVQVGATGTSGDMCSRTCSVGLDCPGRGPNDAACYSIEGAQAICYQRCAIGADCFPTSVCIEVVTDSGSDFICVPET